MKCKHLWSELRRLQNRLNLVSNFLRHMYKIIWNGLKKLLSSSRVIPYWIKHGLIVALCCVITWLSRNTVTYNTHYFMKDGHIKKESNRLAREAGNSVS